MPSGAVVLVDEAGQIGAQQMLELLKLVQANGDRVILSGDTRQHGAVEASDALRAIEKYSGIVPAELTEIRRQNPALGKTAGEQSWIKEYRTAVAEAQAGDVDASFDRLETAWEASSNATTKRRDWSPISWNWRHKISQALSCHKHGMRFNDSMRTFGVGCKRTD